MNANNEFSSKYIHEAYRVWPRKSPSVEPARGMVQVARVVRCWLLSSTLLSLNADVDQTTSIKFKALS
jgi:hypothetical protein